MKFIKSNLMIIILILLIFISIIIESLYNSNQKLCINIEEKQNVIISSNIKQKVGLCESIPDSEVTGILYYTLIELENQNIISGMANYSYTPFSNDSYELWSYVCKNVESKYIEFVDDFIYNLEEDNTDIINDRLKNNDIDLLITYGTRAGIEFYNDKHKVNTINFGSNNPVQSGFIKSIEDSGQDNLWALIDSTKYLNQIKVFYNTVKFQKVGVIQYTDSFRKIFTPIDELEALQKQYGYEFKVYDFYNVDNIFSMGDKEGYYKELINIHKKIANECDAFYMVIGGWEYGDLKYLLKPLIDKKIPVFSQFGSIEVENGALMSTGNVNFTYTGSYLSEVIIKILAGEKPRQIKQEYTEPTEISINMNIAKQIEFKPGIQFINNCDEIYQ